ncbi:ABC transporter ATP-binding protein [Ectothiorhodospira shaposhnikovii]|uniref:ABC transporter ATP-binding protein n=1 Tax=Ectothiorhodospira shaposhnikovii TaxID=1054 RepID=UPI001EE93207|nr:ABC transporter ATP-binding protein [Ectothiorhodospira shaposhnikovii]MCG5513604.1 ABC transporter ATP-binding protein [Ectothiorhodospira shaposhnikovii]
MSDSRLLQPAPAPLLTLMDLVVDIPGRGDGAPLNLDIRAGQCWGILGPNGAGKSTLLHTLAGLRPPRRGTIRLQGQPLGQLPRRRVARLLGMVFQDHQDGFPATVLETALIGRHPYLRPWEMESAEDHQAALKALRQVDLAGMETRLIATLSGGERQRLAIATALTQDPRIFLLDEPTNHLDLHHQVAVLDIVRRAVAEGRSAVLTLHDVNLAARYCDHLLLMYPGGEACWGTTREMLVPNALERLYGQALVTGEVEGMPVFFPRTR